MEEVSQISIDFQSIKCCGGNEAQEVCFSECKHNAFKCSVKKCQCKKAHKDCSFSFFSSILEKIESRRIKITENDIKTINSYSQIINKMIEQLSLMKQKVQRSKQFFGLSISEIQLLQNIRDGHYQKITGNLIKQVKKYEPFVITKEEQIQSYWKRIKQKNFKDFCKDLQSTFYHEPKFCDSLTSQQQLKLKYWFRQKTHKSVLSFQLLYRASQNNYSAEAFHKKCDQHVGTVSLIKTNHGKIIGGYNPNTWEVKKNKSFVEDTTQTAFIFSITEMQKYDCVNYKNSIAVEAKWGPTFGGRTSQQTGNPASADIHVGQAFSQISFGENDDRYDRVDRFDRGERMGRDSQQKFILGARSFSMFPQSYQCSQKVNHGRILAGNTPFKAVDYQVYHVVFEQQN